MVGIGPRPLGRRCQRLPGPQSLPPLLLVHPPIRLLRQRRTHLHRPHSPTQHTHRHRRRPEDSEVFVSTSRPQVQARHPPLQKHRCRHPRAAHRAYCGHRRWRDLDYRYEGECGRKNLRRRRRVRSCLTGRQRFIHHRSLIARCLVFCICRI